MTGACPRSVYGAPCDPIFHFAERRALCRRCGKVVDAVVWLPGRWRAHQYDARVTFWIQVEPGEDRRILVEDFGTSQSGVHPWYAFQAEDGGWEVLEGARAISQDQAPPFAGGARP